MRRTFVSWLLLFLLGSCAIPTLADDGATGVQLGNIRVPRDKFIVFLMIGHCNMMGQARHPESGTHPRAWQFDINQRPPRWVPATSRNNSNQLGAPSLPLLQALAAAYPDYYFGVINNASSAASIQGNYRRGRSNYQQIVRAAQGLKPYVTLGGVLSMLGYMEAEDANQTRAFGDQFIAMTREMRADLGEPDLPFFITQFELGASKKGPGWLAIANTIAQIPQHLSNAAVISTTDFIYDSDHHPSYQSFKLWAVRAAHAISALLAARSLATANQERMDTAPPKFEPPVIKEPSSPIQPPRAVRTQTEMPPNTPNRAATDFVKSTTTAPSQGVVEIEAVLLKASNVPDPRQILPYKEAVASANFEVKQVLSGHLDSQHVLAMQIVIEKGRLLSAANLKVGATYRLKLGTWSSLPRYHTYPMSDDIMDFESPIFFIYNAEPVAPA